MKLFELINECPESFCNTEITGITCDSRIVQKGNIFVCIDGATVDGHKFAESAYKSGAAFIVCQKDVGLPNQIIVNDSRRVFAELCAKWFGSPAKKLKMIGVTGTNGKTSVSYMVKSILESAGHKVGLIGTIQNMICEEVLPSKNTTPSAYELQSMLLLMVAAGCDYCVMEVSSHALDQDRVYGLQFEVSAFTNLTQDHLDYHITMDNYMAAKKKLFYASKTAIMNSDDGYFVKLSDGLNCNIKTFSCLSAKADYKTENIKLRSDGTEFTLKAPCGDVEIKTAIGGKFTPYNSACAAAIALELGVDLSLISTAFLNMTGVKGRAEVVPTGRDFTVIIDYAHTPDGLENILKTFKELPKNRLIVLFGCGGDRDRTKRPKMGQIAMSIADYCVVTSDNPRSEDPKAIIDDILEGMKNSPVPVEVVENRIDAIKKCIQMATKGDIIILAGKGHETYQILNTGTIHLDEREIVAEALAEL